MNKKLKQKINSMIRRHRALNREFERKIADLINESTLPASMTPYSDSPIDKSQYKRIMLDPRKMGKKGGKARAKSLTPKQRSDIAKKAAAARWGKK